jgi:large subunit ribosomal protein L28
VQHRGVTAGTRDGKESLDTVVKVVTFLKGFSFGMVWPKVLLFRLSGLAMSRVCELTGKRANNGMAVSHSHVRTKKLQQVNLQERRLWWAEGNRFIKLRVSTRALKTIQKKGLGAYARELGINLARL